MATDDAMAGAGACGDMPVWQRIGLGVLAEHIPAAVVDQALADTGRVQQRIRRLPARVVVWFVLALALYSGEGYRSVWRQLTHSHGGGGPTPSRSGLSQARRRVGVAPLEALFALLRGPQATPGTPGAFMFGLRLVAWDATTLDVPDSPHNAAAFIVSRNARSRGAFPKVRVMKLIECGTHAVIDASFGRESEQVLARRMLPALDEGMLLLADRNFPSYRLWRAAADTGAHLLWRVKASTPLPRIGVFTDGSWLAVLPQPGTAHRQGIPVRVIDYQVSVSVTDPASGQVSTRSEGFRLLTTIFDVSVASAAALADCYHQRWEAETGYAALKTHQRGPRQVLRSHDPDGVRQELYAYLITYQALRCLLHQAAATEGIDTDRLSFTTALRVVRRFITSAATLTGAVLGHAVTTAISEILEDQHDRRDRASPRVVKRPQSPYRSKNNTNQPRSTPVAYNVEVIEPRHP